jgi:hypothetical protein
LFGDMMHFALLLLFSAVPLDHPPEPAVTFRNDGVFAQYLLARSGAAEDCGAKDHVERLIVDPGQAAVLTTGATPACWCRSAATPPQTCYRWREAEPGSTQVLP